MSYPKTSKSSRIITITLDPKTWPKEGDFIVAVDWEAPCALSNPVGYGFIRDSAHSVANNPYAVGTGKEHIIVKTTRFVGSVDFMMLKSYRIITNKTEQESYMNVASRYVSYSEWAFFMTDIYEKEPPSLCSHILRNNIREQFWKDYV